MPASRSPTSSRPSGYRTGFFVFSESPDPGEQAAGWAAALVLIAFVLVMNILAKVLAGRRRRSIEGG